MHAGEREEGSGKLRHRARDLRKLGWPLGARRIGKRRQPQAFFGLTAMHMLHVTIGVIYLGVIAFRKWFLPVLGVIWIAGAFLIPAGNVFHYPIHALGLGLIISAVILFLKPKDYDAHDVEVSGLYWHFVDLVWMFIFPLVYLMSTKIS